MKVYEYMGTSNKIRAFLSCRYFLYVLNRTELNKQKVAYLLGIVKSQVPLILKEEACLGAKAFLLNKERIRELNEKYNQDNKVKTFEDFLKETD